MLKYTTGNIVKSNTEAIVNTVNTMGVMGKGIALAFKEAFPLNYKLYVEACKSGNIDIGKLFVTETGELYPKYIINFPTKKHWRYSSNYDYISKGLTDLVRILREYQIKSISIPSLGSGNGRLDWSKVKNLIIQYLSEIAHNTEIIIFEPGFNNQRDIPAKEIGLTDQRAIFIYLLSKYQNFDNEINLLAAHKLAYLLQKFGEQLNLDFDKGIYGPYSSKLNHLLKYINNAYIEFDENNNSPMTEIKLIDKKLSDVNNYYNNNLSSEQKDRVNKILSFIDGFESTYGLELLATIDFIKCKTGKHTFEEIQEEVGNWTQRKKNIMQPYHIKVALNRLNEYNLF